MSLGVMAVRHADTVTRRMPRWTRGRQWSHDAMLRQRAGGDFVAGRCYRSDAQHVVGAGPTGLTMAIELARRGLVVRLIEQSAEPPLTSRALVVQPRTLELFDDMGVIDAALAASRGVHSSAAGPPSLRVSQMA